MAALKQSDYMRMAHQIEQQIQNGEQSGSRLAVLSSFSANFLKPYLIVQSDNSGVTLSPWFAPFNQFEQLVLDAKSELWTFNPSVIWLALRLEDIDPWLVYEHFELTPNLVEQRLHSIVDRLHNMARQIRSRHRASILVSNLVLPHAISASQFDANDPDGLVYQVNEANRTLARELKSIADAHLFDYARVVASSGSTNWRDNRLWHMARIACSAENQIALSQAVTRAALALLRPAAKCIVLDLDNTIWGGVIGDDGIEGIKIGDDYPGNVYKEFQEALLAFRRQGFLLAICSKNTESIVLEALDTHPEMILRREHFAAIYANWDPKPVNIRKIAEALNIGIDSLVFIDDNPVERAQVAQELPMVQVVDLPPDPLLYLSALHQIAELDRPRLLDEDKNRAIMYQQDTQRQQLEQRAGNLDDFLKNLGMVATIGLANSTNLERIHQLINKTNQFNLTTRRHNLDDVRRFMNGDSSRVAWLRLRDKFGDLGLVCVGIVKVAGDTSWEIDTFLMSCRVMGRQVEAAFLSYLFELVRNAGGKKIVGTYIKTKKNGMVENFFPQFGFALIRKSQDGNEIEYELEVNSDTLAWPVVLTREEQ